jgi:hypothetical protein
MACGVPTVQYVLPEITWSLAFDALLAIAPTNVLLLAARREA